MSIMATTLFVIGILFIMGLIIGTSSLRYSAKISNEYMSSPPLFVVDGPKPVVREDKESPDSPGMEDSHCKDEIYELVEITGRQKYFLEQAGFYKDQNDNFYSVN